MFLVCMFVLNRSSKLISESETFSPGPKPLPFVNLKTMEWLFGRKKTPAEMLKEHQRALKKAMR